MHVISESESLNVWARILPGYGPNFDVVLRNSECDAYEDRCCAYCLKVSGKDNASTDIVPELEPIPRFLWMFAAHMRLCLPTRRRVSIMTDELNTHPILVNTAADDADGLSAAEVDRGLARLDPLTVRPRTSSRVLCAIFAVFFFAASAGVWWLGVRTMEGQSYDDLVFSSFKSEAVPGWLAVMIRPLVSEWVSASISVVLMVVALIVVVARRRWWAIGQSVVLVLACAASSLLKEYLPRPYLINVESQQSNSAPSGHMLLAVASGMVLVFAVSRAWRAVAAMIAVGYASLTGLSLIYGQWHRPTDVVMSLCIAAGWMMLVMIFTRASSMDRPGTRVSSTSIQIVASVLITAGVMALLYSAYLLWQIQPGLSLSAQWTHPAAHVSAIAAIVGLSALVFGLEAAMRQITAAPLSKLGLVGAPPTPPTQ